MKPNPNPPRDLYQEAVTWLRGCLARFIAPGTLERRFQIGAMQTEALAEQLQAAGIVSPPLPPYNQRRNRVCQKKSKGVGS